MLLMRSSKCVQPHSHTTHTYTHAHSHADTLIHSFTDPLTHTHSKHSVARWHRIARGKLGHVAAGNWKTLFVPLFYVFLLYSEPCLCCPISKRLSQLCHRLLRVFFSPFLFFFFSLSVFCWYFFKRSFLYRYAKPFPIQSVFKCEMPAKLFALKYFVFYQLLCSDNNRISALFSLLM